VQNRHDLAHVRFVARVFGDDRGQRGTTQQ
jgi:hypothetical protein